MSDKNFISENSHSFSVKFENQKLGLFYLKKGEKHFVFESKNVTTSGKQISYFIIPYFISIKKKETTFTFENLYPNDCKKQFIDFKEKTLLFTKNIIKTFKKKILLKGLGMRIQYLDKNNLLRLKLGFSYFVEFPVPLNLKIYTNKNLLIVESSDSVLVGNFTNLVCSLKRPNIYNGKGFWLKNQIIKLKPIKKS
jgi:large subunit ribosomal protein L6